MVKNGVRQLENVEATGVELCLPSLLADAKRLLTRPQLPGLELSRISKGSFSNLVGQQCAVKRPRRWPVGGKRVDSVLLWLVLGVIT